jgi:hypothetical protein
MFKNCKSIEEAKKIYRELSKKNHPDRGGSEESMKVVNLEYEKFLNNFIEDRAKDFSKDKDYDINSEPFSDILNKVIHFDVTIEIIGFWIYITDCWTNEMKAQLTQLGFWYSKKHKSFVFSGSKKKKVKSILSTEDIRDIHGSTSIKEKEEREERKAIA